MSKAFLTAARKASTEGDSVDLQEMLIAFRNGSIEARDAIIRAHFKVIANIARKCSRSSSHEDDICGDALYLLTKAVEQAKTNLAHDNLTGYIIASVAGSLRSARFRYERSLCKPPSTYSSQKKKGEIKEILPPESSRFQATAKREQPSLDFLEILDGIAKTNREREVINLRKQSYSYEEIAELLDLSPSRVGQIMAILTERFDRIYS